jgi:hypothetical protein
VATIIVAVVVAIYIAVNLACIAYYWRFQRQEASVLRHVVFPILGIAAFVPAFFTAMGLPILPGGFIGRLPHPLNKAGIAMAIAYFIGIVYLVYLYATDPERIRATGRIFIGEEPAVEARRTEPGEPAPV